MLRIMAGPAANADVLAVERVSGLRVIESLWRRVPVQQVEVFSVVIGVAFYAGSARWSRARVSGVQTFVVH